MASSPEISPPGDENGNPGGSPPPPNDENGNSGGSPPPSDDNGNTEPPPGDDIGDGAQSPPIDDGNAGSPPDDSGNVEPPPAGGVSPPADSSLSPPSQPPPQGQTPPHSPPSSSPPVTGSPPVDNNLPLPSPTAGQSPPVDSGSNPVLPNPDNPSTSVPLIPPPVLLPPSGSTSRTLPSSPALSNSPPGSGSSTGSSQNPRNSIQSSDPNAAVAAIVGIVGGGVVIIVLLCALLMFSRRKKKEQYYTNNGQPPKGMEHVVKLPPAPGTFEPSVSGWGMPTGFQSSGEFSYNDSGQHPLNLQSPSPFTSKSQFSYEELSMATNGFSQANVLGQGGFGFVHKGVLSDGKEVAVKSLKSGSGQGEREFQAEVEIISRVHHRHLVSLVGYCIASDKRMLVYEFVPNGTLEFHLHGQGHSQQAMDWESRLRIAVGSAKGLAYLHEDCEPRIIHRDIKAANILIDLHFEAKVADFGLAKLTSDNFTHVSTRVMGTFGYLAPEYAASGKLSEKSDVFSFGVMLLELITGRRPVDPKNIMEDSLVDWARPLMSQAIENGDYSKLADSRLEHNYNQQKMAHLVACANACVRHSARKRPRMSQVVRALEGDSSLDDLNVEVKLGGGSGGSMNMRTNREIYDTQAYNADLVKFKKMIQPTQEFNSTRNYGDSST